MDVYFRHLPLVYSASAESPNLGKLRDAFSSRKNSKAYLTPELEEALRGKDFSSIGLLIAQQDMLIRKNHRFLSNIEAYEHS